MSTAQRGIFYRHFDLPVQFPVIGLLRPAWESEHQESFRLHFHNCLEIGLMLEGEATYYLRDQVVALKAPCLTMAPPNAPHMTNSLPGKVCTWKWLYVDPIRLLPGMAPAKSAEMGVYQYQMRGRDCVILPEKEPEVFALVQLIVDVMEKMEPDWQGIARELFHALFLMLLSRHPLTETRGSVSAYEGVLAPAISYIQEAYMQDLTVPELAERCHLSEAHFRRIFKDVYGWPPLDYIHTIRIERACKLLFDGTLSVSEIAEAVGYRTPSTFTRQFHHFYGLSPSQWRQKMESEENTAISQYMRAQPPQSQGYYPEEYLQRMEKEARRKES
ncbi:MAG: helix-turn-helix transcriptional regulator [Clostridia bacterium]|nr:helix-turn-helix transcriptional regulator [Clostridia bacterium]